MINWLKFVTDGFEKATEIQSADKFLLNYGAAIKPSENDLHIRWRKVAGIKEYVLCCTCGNARMTVHENCIRCQSCGRAHSHENFQKKRLEVKRIANFGEGRLEILPQPFINVVKTYDVATKFRQFAKKFSGKRTR